MKKSIYVSLGLGACLMTLFWLRILSQRPITPTADAIELVQKERKLAKQAGLPLTLAELPYRKTPPAQNLATYLKQFSELDRKTKLTEDEKQLLYSRLLSWDKITPQETEQAKLAFQKYKSLYDLIEKSSACIAYSVPIKWSSATYMDDAVDFPQKAMLRGQARWILARTSLFLAERRYAEAAKNSLTGLKLAHLSEKENPTLIDLVVSHAVRAIALKGVQKVLYEARDVPDVVEELAKELERTPLPAPMSRTIPIETLLQRNLLQSIKADVLKERNPLKKLEGENKTDWNKYGYLSNDKSAVDRYCALNEAHLLQGMCVALKSLAKPYYLGVKDARLMITELEAHADAPDYYFAEFALTCLKSGRNQASAVASQSVTTIMAQVMVWKTRHGRFPDNLTEIYKEVPVDPFDGKPMRYRKEEGGFTTWSVGETLKYDGRATKQNESVLYFHPPTTK
ncbi:hypothetical protein LBMAG21_04400 [Armatimonadota bacterium]|nr:hypothetical protein LBMAG21_04400 [Armatimonadota bacterium]